MWREKVRLLPFKRATTLGWQSMPRNPANGGKVYNIISIPAASCNIKSDQFHIQLILLNDVLNNVLVPPAKPTPTSLGGLVLLLGCFSLPAKPPWFSVLQVPINILLRGDRPGWLIPLGRNERIQTLSARLIGSGVNCIIFYYFTWIGRGVFFVMRWRANNIFLTKSKVKIKKLRVKECFKNQILFLSFTLSDESHFGKIAIWKQIHLAVLPKNQDKSKTNKM